MRSQYYDHVCNVDFETFWRTPDYSLRSKDLSQTDYIRHPLFECQSVSMRHSDWPEARVERGDRALEFLNDSVDWSTTAFCAHHTHFDGLIASHYFGVEPIFWMCTQSMAREIHGVDVSSSFVAVSARLGLPGKPNADALQNVNGVLLKDMTKAQLAHLMLYNKQDADGGYKILEMLAPHFTEDEFRVLDLTLRMYCEPLIKLDGDLLQKLYTREKARRKALFAAAGVTPKVLNSGDQFAEALRDVGVIPPMKISKKTGEPAYAFAKTDQAFKDLLEHPEERVRTLVAARFGAKGNLVENRSKRLLMRTGLPCPVYLGYWAARTGRWGGGDKVNLQNLPSRGDGANLRRALVAPPGTKFIVADASQIEARMLAWLAGDLEKLQRFRAYDAGTGPNLYCVAAGSIYGRTIDKYEDPLEYFVGKQFELSGGYGAGAKRIQGVLKLGATGPAIDMELHDVKAFLKRWRILNQKSVDYWDTINDAATKAFLQGLEVELGPIIFERFKADGYMHMPNGTYQKYPQVGFDPHNNNLYYNSRNGAVKLWGGILTENEDQGLSCALLKQQMLWMTDQLPELRICLLVHDETVCLVPEELADEYAVKVQKIMSTAADWCPDLPLNADVKVCKVYDK